MRSFKGIRRYNSSKSMREPLLVPTRPCVYVWTYACFLAAIFFLLLAEVREVADTKGVSGPSKAVSLITLRLPTKEPPEDETCQHRRVYMYDLPPEYNTALEHPSRCNHSLIPWMDLCPRFRNGGFGTDLHSSESSSQYPDSEFYYSDWYETDLFMLEVVFHNRMKSYRCLTKDWSQADAFYLPYYTGLLALNYLYTQAGPGDEVHERSYEERRVFGHELVEWLENNGGEAWRRYRGKDHFIVLGRTTWDFKLRETWSVGFSDIPHVANMTSLIIESLPGLDQEQAIPYPTVFHPNSPEKLQSWLQRVRTVRRKYLFSYVGAPREDPTSVRGIMTSSCKAAGEDVCNSVDCSVIRCSHDPLPLYNSFLQSDFCLQPRGDTATRRSAFDCLISGAIPVFFHRDSAYTQYSWHFPMDQKSYSVFIDEEDLKRGVSIEQVLRAYSQKTIIEMRENVVSIIPSLLYFDCRKDGCSSMNETDAFEVTVDRLLQKIAFTKETLDTNHS